MRAHARALSVLQCPAMNSDRRLMIGNDASGTNSGPVFTAWGDNTRTAMVPVPGRGSKCGSETAR